VRSGGLGGLARERPAQTGPGEGCVKTCATKLMGPTFFFAMVAVVCAAAIDQPAAAHDAPRAILALSVITAGRRAEPQEDLRFNHNRPVQFIERTRFSQAEREKMRAFHLDFVQAWQAPLLAEVACPQAQRYAQRILDRLIEGSRLRQPIQHADFPVQLEVTCGVADFPDAEIKAGVLEVSAELLLALPSEDEIAAMMGHELAHYTLAHGERRLEIHSRLTPFSARALSIDHEIEADTEGLVLLANAGYDPYAAVDALKVIRAILLARRLQTDAAHPNLDDRIRNLQQQIIQAGMQAVPRRTQGLAAIQAEIRQRPAALLKNARAMLAPD
jgi:Zn-dependent protease with chaperone function